MWHKFRSFSLRAQIGIWLAAGLVALASLGALTSPPTKPASSNTPLTTPGPATFAVVAMSPAPTAAPTVAPTVAPTPEPTPTSTAAPTAKPTPIATAVAPTVASPRVKTPPTVKPATPKPAPAPAPAATQTPTTGSAVCSPLSNAGNCYKPGQTCRDSDHLAAGIGAGGQAIRCVNNNGWRWEPA